MNLESAIRTIILMIGIEGYEIDTDFRWDKVDEICRYLGDNDIIDWEYATEWDSQEVDDIIENVFNELLEEREEDE